MMPFYRKKPVTAAVPIVPMIDILTILLIFFIIHTQWKKPQHLLSIDVPATEYIKGAEKKENRAVLSVGADSRVSLDGNLVDIESLGDRLIAFKRDNPGRELQLDVDQGASFGVVVRIWDMLTAAGIDAKEVPARIELKAKP